MQFELRTKWQDELTNEKRELESQVDRLKKQCLHMRMTQVLTNK